MTTQMPEPKPRFIPLPAGVPVVTPKHLTKGHLNLLWGKLRPEHRAELCDRAKTLIEVKDLPDMGGAVTPIRLLDLFQCAGQAAYKLHHVASCALANGLGIIKHDGEVVADANTLAPKDEDGLPKAVRTGSAVQPTAKLWIPSFSLPKEGEKVESFEAYCMLRDAIGHDHAQFLKAKAELLALAEAAISLCEDGKKQLAAIAPGWQIVGNLVAEADKITKAIEGLTALGDNDAAVAEVIQRQKDRLATTKTHLAAATQAAQEGRVWEAPKDVGKKVVGKTKTSGD